MRILVSGDSHCDINHLSAMTAKMKRMECDKAYVVGDFGFWPKDTRGQKFLKAIAELEYPVYFTDGNHDDHVMLEEHFKQPCLDEEGFIQVSENLYWAHRGFQWEWDGVKFGSLGGAYSIDRNRRTKFISWFPNEVVTDEDVERALMGSKIDIMLTHDCPAEVDLPLVFGYQGLDSKFWIEEETEKNRAKISRVMEKWEPQVVIHGHWHVHYSKKITSPYGSVNVMGLNCNTTKDWWTVIDTEDRKK